MSIQNLVKNMLLAVEESSIVSDLGKRLELRLNELRAENIVTKEQEAKILKAAALRRKKIYEERRLDCVDIISKMKRPEAIKKLFRRVSNEKAKARALLQPEQSLLKISMSSYLDEKNIDLFRAEVSERFKELKSSQVV